MCQRRRLMYWLLRGGLGLCVGCVADCSPSAHWLPAWLPWSGRVWRGLVWCDGSSVEISITQANDKWTCSHKFSRLLSGRPGNPLWRHAANRPLSMWACHSHAHMRKVQYVKWLRKTCATLPRPTVCSDQICKAPSGSSSKELWVGGPRVWLYAIFWLQSCRDLTAFAWSSCCLVTPCLVTLAFA